MTIYTITLWVGSAILNPNLGEVGFDQFRQSINHQVEMHLKSIHEDPLDAMEYFNLGLAYMAIGHHKLEINSYLEAIRLYSNYAKAHFNLAMAYDILKDGEAAIRQAKEAEVLYGKQRKHQQVRKVRRQLNILNEKYKQIPKNLLDDNNYGDIEK